MVKAAILLRAFVADPSDTIDVDNISEQLEDSVKTKKDVEEIKVSERAAEALAKKLLEVCEDMCELGYI